MIEWWEYLIWDEMKCTWDKLPEETRKKIRAKGLGPKE